jgi:hypothetical protein
LVVVCMCTTTLKCGVGEGGVKIVLCIDQYSNAHVQ